MAAQDNLQPKQFLDLYHHTDPDKAEAIYDRGFDPERSDNQTAAYFSTHKNSDYVDAFGAGVVHARVPARIAQLDDEFPSGEQHYAVHIPKLRGTQYLVRDDDAPTKFPASY